MCRICGSLTQPRRVPQSWTGLQIMAGHSTCPHQMLTVEMLVQVEAIQTARRTPVQRQPNARPPRHVGVLLSQWDLCWCQPYMCMAMGGVRVASARNVHPRGSSSTACEVGRREGVRVRRGGGLMEQLSQHTQSHIQLWGEGSQVLPVYGCLCTQGQISHMLYHTVEAPALYRPADHDARACGQSRHRIPVPAHCCPPALPLCPSAVDLFGTAAGCGHMGPRDLQCRHHFRCIRVHGGWSKECCLGRS